MTSERLPITRIPAWFPGLSADLASRETIERQAREIAGKNRQIAELQAWADRLEDKIERMQAGTFGYDPNPEDIRGLDAHAQVSKLLADRRRLREPSARARAQFLALHADELQAARTRANAAVRAWAAGHEHQLYATGGIPAAVYEAYVIAAEPGQTQ